MARFTIKSADGQQDRYTGCPTYHGTFLKPAYIEFSQIASPTPIAWEIGDYVDYARTGFRYRLYSVPQPEKSAVRHAAGDSFVYNNVQFFCATKDLEIAPFRDLVISDNRVHFTTLPDVATYEDVFGIARRIQANLDSFYGEGAWVVRVFDTSDSDLRAVMLQTKDFSLSDGSCIDALTKIYELWKGIGWVYSVENGVNTITIGRANVQDRDNTASVFAYGVGNGLKVIKKEQSAKNDLATRLYAYGSTRNMIARYYNNITPAIKDADSVYIPNLMIPLSHWGDTDEKKDASKAYLEADPSVIARHGLRPKTIYFDGNGDYEEIFPSIEGMTAGQIRAAMQPTDEYYPSTVFFPDTMRVDEVAGAVNPSDNGVISTESGGKYAQTVSVLGVAYSLTRNLSVGENQARISLNNISVANTISASGKVHVDTAFQGTIACDETLSVVSVVLWLEIGGVKYGERQADIVRGKNGVFAVSLESFDINTENTGSVSLKGYVEFERPSADKTTQVLINIAPGTTTLSVEFTPAQTFTVEIPQVGFDISKQQSSVSGGICTLSFKSGWCAGRDFTVKKCEYVGASDRWRLTVARQNDESIGQYFPNSVYRVERYDRFVLLDLTMPEIYHTAAEQRLYERASEVLGAISTPKYVYEPDVDAKVLAKNPETLIEGMYMPLSDDDVIGEDMEFVLIDSIEIDEGSEAIPTYRVTLQDEKRENFISRLTRESGRNTRTITEITLRDLRNEVEELTPSVTTDSELSVRVVASHPIIGYRNSFDEEPVNTVVLTCETKGIDNPTYQWYFRGAISWVPIPGATGQSYAVVPDGNLYYLNGEVVEDFRCVVSGDEGLSATVQVMKVISNAITLSLSNPAHVFKAGDEFAVADTDTSDVLGYRGVERIETNVKQSAIRFLNTDGTVIPATYAGGRLVESTGKYLTTSNGEYLVVAGAGGAGIYNTDSNLMMSVEVVNNNTASAYLSIAVTDKMNIPVGKIEIPVIIREAEGDEPEKVVTLYYSWALALKGESPLIADITNEADGVGVGSNELLETTVTLNTTVFLYYGTNEEVIASATAAIPSAYTGKITYNTVINTGGKSATITFTLSGTTANPINFVGVNSVEIPITVTGARGSRTVTYSLLPIADGEDGAVFVLVPSADCVKGSYNASDTLVYTPTPVSCERMMRTGSGSLSTSTYGVLKYSVDGGTTRDTYSSAVAASSAASAGRIIFYWYTDAQETALIDRETIPIVVDGASPLVADMTNEADGIAVGSDGVLTASPDPLTTAVHIYSGNVAQTITAVTENTSLIPASFRNKFTITKSGLNTTEATVSIAISASTSSPIDFTGVDSVRIPMDVVCGKGSRTVVYTIIIVKDGEDGAVFMLQPDADVIKGERASGNTVAYSPTTVSCTRKMRKGSGALSDATTIGNLYVIKNATDTTPTETAYTDGTNINVSEFASHGKVIFVWRLNGVVIDRETIPVVVDGAKGDSGFSTATINLYRKYVGSSAPAKPTTTFKYTFNGDSLTLPDDTVPADYDGWYRQIPSGVGPTFITTAHKEANTASVNIVSADWSTPTRWTGEDGLQGKIMRGINQWVYDQTLPDGGEYQGLEDVVAGHIYYDVVWYVTPNTTTRKYYYCKVYQKKINDVDTPAKKIAPGTDTDVWVEATNFDFIATDVLLAANAFIDVLTGNGFYLYKGSTDGTYIVAGAQGGQGVNFFAGTEIGKSESDTSKAAKISAAPFKVSYDGSIDASKLHITSNGTAGGSSIVISKNSVVVFQVTNEGALTATNAMVRGKIITGTEAAQPGSYDDSSLVSLKGLFVNQGGARIVGDTTVHNGNLSVDKTDENARHHMKAQYGNEYAEVSVASNGLAKLESVDGNDSVSLELLGTNNDATLTRGSGRSESIVTSPDIKHIVKVSSAPTPAEAEYDTMYLVELSQQQQS